MKAEENHDLSLSQCQAIVDEWIRTVGVRYFSPLTNMAILTEEVGEVARVIARLDGDQSCKAGEQLNLADELSDVLWVVLALANQHNIDISKAFAENIAKKSRRDSERHKNNPKLSTPYSFEDAD